MTRLRQAGGYVVRALVGLALLAALGAVLYRSALLYPGQ